MFRVNLGSAGRYCDGIHRRSFLQLGVAGMASLGLGDVLKARANSPAAQGGTRNTAVILIWLDGGPSHMDLYDLKPDAPAEYRGIWRPIRSRVPGFDVSELFPKQARVTNLFSIVRSLHHNTGDHFAGGHRMLTTKDMGVSGANNAQKFPGIGAIVSRELGPRRRGIPGYIGVLGTHSIGLAPGYHGGHMLGAQHNPYQPGGDPNAPSYSVQNLNFAPGLTIDRLEDRRHLNRHFDGMLRSIENMPTAHAIDRFNQEAFDFVTGPIARRASTAKTRGSATATAGRAGARACSWPAGSSKPGRRSSPAPSAAGTTTGICRRAWNATCRRSMPRWPRCSKT